MKIIKKILTAIGNSDLNNELKITNKFAVIGNDILYKEGIIETLEINKNIDYIIINESLPGEIDTEELIDNIKTINEKIKIYIFMKNKNEEKIKKINSLNIDKIIYDKLDKNNIINLIFYDNNLEKYNSEINKEIEKIKNNIKNQNNIKINNNILLNFKKEKNNNKIIFLKNKNIKFIIKQIISFKETIIVKIKNNVHKKYNYINIFKNIIKNNKILKIRTIVKNKNINNKLLAEINYKKINNNGKIISVLGNNGAGKSSFSVLLANLLKKDNNKILIIDFDFLNNSLHTILGVKKYPDKIKNILKNNNENNSEKINIENLIIKINKNINLISGINLIFKSEKNIEIDKLKLLFNKLINDYNYIIIDTSSECFFDYTKEIMEISYKCFFITEANLPEISKSKRFLEIYNNNWNINNEKIKIIFNKYNKNCIDLNLLKKLYFEYEIIGKINIKNNYNFSKEKINIINQNKNIFKKLFYKNNSIKNII